MRTEMVNIFSLLYFFGRKTIPALSQLVDFGLVARPTLFPYSAFISPYFTSVSRFQKKNKGGNEVE